MRDSDIDGEDEDDTNGGGVDDGNYFELDLDWTLEMIMIYCSFSFVLFLFE